MIRRVSLLAIPLVVAGYACSSTPPVVVTPPKDPGALIDATMSSQVGVLLDEVPMGIRDRVAAALMARPTDFWIERARSQARLTTFRLVFRRGYYDTDKDSLPLPLSDAWTVKLGGAPTRKMVEGHDVVSVDYTLATTILTTLDSPAHCEPALAEAGGTWDEPFIFPIDPELILQRTGFACMNEAEFPQNSVDSEETDAFYDQNCGVEDALTHTGCHFSSLPQQSCPDAVSAKIGKITTKLHFERKPWDAAAADKARVGDITTKAGANLKTIDEQFKNNRIIYRYIAADSCTIEEKCVAAPGWRRLLQFTSADTNTGNGTMAIGALDYFGTDDAGTPLSQHGEFEWSACHQHFHFSHYAAFSYGTGSEQTVKRGFCLQSTERASNNELSPLSNAFWDCSFQGIEVGWADEYRAGLECQWVDVTGEDTSTATVTKSLAMHTNPDGFLCEGKPVLDAMGGPIWETTTFLTKEGTPVQKPKCDLSPGWDQDNVDKYDVTLPLDGNGYVTTPCTRGQLGPLRNCGFTKADDTLKCTPGAKVTLSCTVPAGAEPQALRVCETSAVLKTGIPCIFDQALATSGVDTSGAATVTFTCPNARDANEPGGGYALYTGALFPDDMAQTVTCTAM
jgi:hypothetical protein